MNTTNETAWIARAEREPTTADFPVEFYHQSWDLPVRCREVVADGYTHWRPYRFTPPVVETPAQAQEGRDRQWAREFIKQARERKYLSWEDEVRDAHRQGREDCREVVEAVAGGDAFATEGGKRMATQDAARRLCAAFGWKGGAK